MTDIVFADSTTKAVFLDAGKTAGGDQRLVKAPFNLVRIGGTEYIETDNIGGVDESTNVSSVGLAGRDYNTEIAQLGRGGTFIDGFITLPDSHGSSDGDDIFSLFELGHL